MAEEYESPPRPLVSEAPLRYHTGKDQNYFVGCISKELPRDRDLSWIGIDKFRIDIPGAVEVVVIVTV
jgi:hypothetical protein